MKSWWFRKADFTDFQQVICFWAKIMILWNRCCSSFLAHRQCFCVEGIHYRKIHKMKHDISGWSINPDKVSDPSYCLNYFILDLFFHIALPEKIFWNMHRNYQDSTIQKTMLWRHRNENDCISHKQVLNSHQEIVSGRMLPAKCFLFIYFSIFVFTVPHCVEIIRKQR